MFESTIAASTTQPTNKLGPLSLALGLHGAAVIGFAAFSLLALHIPPDPKIGVVIWHAPIKVDLTGGGGSPEPPAPQSHAPVPQAPPRRDELVQPHVTPVPPEPAPEAPATSSFDDLPTGSPVGVPGGTGPADGGWGGEEGSGIGPGDGRGESLEPLPVGGSIAKPRLIRKVSPEYPVLARTIRKEGRVVLEAIIAPDGTVSNVRVIESSFAGFNDPAVEAVRQWRYTPPSQDGRPVSVYFQVVVEFTLR